MNCIEIEDELNVLQLELIREFININTADGLGEHFHNSANSFNDYYRLFNGEHEPIFQKSFENLVKKYNKKDYAPDNPNSIFKERFNSFEKLTKQIKEKDHIRLITLLNMWEKNPPINPIPRRIEKNNFTYNY